MKSVPCFKVKRISLVTVRLSSVMTFFMISGSKSIHQKTLKKMGSVLVGLMLIYGIASHTLLFVVSATESLPYRFFVLQKRSISSTPCPKKRRMSCFIIAG